MAGTAVLVGHFRAVGKGERLMDLVAGNTVLEFLAFGMGFMAVEAARDIAMGVGVAVGTVNLGMCTFVGIDFLNDLGMTGITGGLEIAFQDNLQRLVRIAMAAQAVLQFKMRFTFVAIGALRNKRAFCNSRRMGALMAFEAFNFGFVFGAGLVNLLNNHGMTFFTIFVAQSCCGSSIGSINIHKKSSDKESCSNSYK